MRVREAYDFVFPFHESRLFFLIRCPVVASCCSKEACQRGVQILLVCLGRDQEPTTGISSFSLTVVNPQYLCKFLSDAKERQWASDASEFCFSCFLHWRFFAPILAASWQASIPTRSILDIGVLVGLTAQICSFSISLNVSKSSYQKCYAKPAKLIQLHFWSDSWNLIQFQDSAFPWSTSCTYHLSSFSHCWIYVLADLGKLATSVDSAWLGLRHWKRFEAEKNDIMTGAKLKINTICHIVIYKILPKQKWNSFLSFLYSKYMYSFSLKDFLGSKNFAFGDLPKTIQNDLKLSKLNWPRHTSGGESYNVNCVTFPWEPWRSSLQVPNVKRVTKENKRKENPYAMSHAFGKVRFQL